ncbi:MAG: hypothetical protein ABI891_11550 [Acidobacteriota bacterium]
MLILFTKLSPKELFMIIRKSFYIRWLLYTGDDRQPEHSVIEVKHIQSGNSRNVSSLEEAAQWMRDAKEERKDDQVIKNE